MQSVDIARESTVQEALTNIGDNSDTGSDTGTTLFGKVKYAVSALGTLGARLTTSRVEKLDGIGEASDGAQTASVFGKLNKIEELAGGEQGETVTIAVSGEDETVTFISAEDEPVSIGSGYPRLGSFKADSTGEYLITATVKGIRSFLTVPNVGILILEYSDGDNQPITVLSVQNESPTSKSGTVFMNAGKTYGVYGHITNISFGTGEVSLLKIQHSKEKESVFTETIQPSGTAVSTISPSPAQGTDTSFTQIASVTASGDGALRLTIAVASSYVAKTRLDIQVNGTSIYNSSPVSGTSNIYDVAVKKGDVIAVRAAAVSGDNPAWRVGTITVGYSTVLKGINPYYINTWEEITP